MNKEKQGMDYTAEIEKFYEEFPEHRGQTFITNPDTDNTVEDFIDETPVLTTKLEEYQYIDTLKQKGVTEDTIQKAIDLGLFLNIEQLEKLYKKNAYCCSYYNVKEFFNEDNRQESNSYVALILLPQEKNVTQNSVLPSAFNQASFNEISRLGITQKYSFYHETGHALYNKKHQDEQIKFIKHAREGKHQGEEFYYNTEAAAESYALIRLSQEYGINNPAIQLIIAERTFDRLKFPEDSHNFLSSIHEVARLAKKGELDNLTARQSAELATKIAEEKTITPWQSREIRYRLGNAYKSILSEKSLEKSLPNFTVSVAHITEPIVLNDAQYIVQCLDDLSSNDPKMQKTVQKMWAGLNKNKLIQESGFMKQDWRATGLQVKPKETLTSRIKKLITKF